VVDLFDEDTGNDDGTSKIEQVYVQIETTTTFIIINIIIKD